MHFTMNQMIAFLLVLLLASSAGATPVCSQGRNGTRLSTASPYTETTGVSRKRSSGPCEPKMQGPHVKVTGNWTDIDQPEIADLDYYRFSAKNIMLSSADDWYAAWTIARQNDTEWAELGEWKLFAKDFAQTYNFECDLAFGSCINYPSLGDLQRMWPCAGNRPVVRRIFFIFQRYSMAHDYVKSINEAFDHTHAYVTGLVPELIETFSLQVDSTKKMKCDQLTRFVGALTNLALQAVSTAIVGMAAPEVVSVSLEVRTMMAELRALKKAVAKSAGKSMTQSVQLKIAELEKGIEEGYKKTGKLSWMITYGPITNTVRKTGVSRNIVWSGLLLNNFGFFEGLVQADWKASEEFYAGSIGPGIAHGTLCSEFEGNWADNNAGNRDNLVSRLSSVFESSRRQRQAMFQALYRGFVPASGQPSGAAMWLKTRDWVGPGSVLDDMRDISSLENEIKTAVVKGLISDTLTSDFNYIKCGYKDDAAVHCKNAQSDDPGKDLSVFCPHADTDPQFMCDSRRWYFADKSQHDIPMVAATKLESFAGNRFNFTQQEFLTESFQNYELFTHRKPTTDYGGWGYSNSPSKGPGFNIPVCVSDKPRFFEKQGYPSICGDWHASETGSFIEAMHAGVNSSMFQYRRHSKAMSLYTSIIPGALDAFPPLTRYLGLCANSLHFPQKDEITESAQDWLRAQPGKDEDCGLVQNGTKDMTDEEEANRWFCKNAGGHSIFKREWPQAEANGKKAKYMKSHKRKCKHYLKNPG